MTKTEEIEGWLKKNKLKYLKGKCGTLTVGLNQMSSSILSEYQDFCYHLQTKYKQKI